MNSGKGAAMASPESDGTGKRGVVMALVALVAVLVAAAVGYQVLAGSASVGPAANNANAPSSAAAGDEDALWLADFDATVYSDLGDATPLTKLADGRPLVINFWATWCPYCIDEMDDFQAIYDDYSDRVAFAFVDATDGNRETIEDAKAWVESHSYTLPFYYDIQRQAVAAFGIGAFPTTVVVAPDGEILAISSGRIDDALMRSALDSLL